MDLGGFDSLAKDVSEGSGNLVLEVRDLRLQFGLAKEGVLILKHALLIELLHLVLELELLLKQRGFRRCEGLHFLFEELGLQGVQLGNQVLVDRLHHFEADAFLLLVVSPQFVQVLQKGHSYLLRQFGAHLDFPKQSH